jgi:uncharacterized membrane protein
MKIVLYVICAILALVILWFALLFVSGLFISKDKEYNTNSKYYRFLLNFSTAVAMRLIRIKIRTKTLRNRMKSRRLTRSSV